MHPLPGVVSLYTAVEMRTVDRLAVEEVGIPNAVLMERAGLAAANEIRHWFADARRVAIVCGAGSNGGDGFVVARHLAEAGFEVEVLLVEAESKIRREPKLFLQVLRKLNVAVRRVNVTGWKSAFGDRDLIVDAMLGTGSSDAPRPPFEAAIRAIRASLLPVVSLDVPTGVNASDGTIAGAVVQADLTITFHAPKMGIVVAPGRFCAGRVKAVDIGLPALVDEPLTNGLVTPELLQLVPARRRSGSKYDATVCSIGGSTGMAGAISLTAQAALRAGAGVSWALTPEPIAQALDSSVAEVQFRGFLADAAGRLSIAAAESMEPIVQRADCVVLGPGIGESDQVRALARWAATRARALVLDAQGIAAFAAGDLQLLAARDGAPTLLTPHEGELATLLGVSSEQVRARRLEHVREAARLTRCTVLLKGEDTIVCLPAGDVLVCRSHVAQATSGSGDVLAGAAAALIARGMDAPLAGACAATACGIAAESVTAGTTGAGMIASDMLHALPEALHHPSSHSQEPA